MLVPVTNFGFRTGITDAVNGREQKRAMNTNNKTTYILGHSPAEIQRLQAHVEMLRPITERLLLSAGIGPGMRVLDIGCGAGDVAMVAAELVGSSGSVVGIDRDLPILNAPTTHTLDEFACARSQSLDRPAA